MDELGYYCLWTAEHHFQHEGYEVFPNLILLLDLAGHPDASASSSAAPSTSCPCGTPSAWPRTYAMADIITGGRVIMGVGRGYHTREVESFGAPMLDNAANKELFEEQMEVLLKCFDQESWSHHGKHYTIPAGRAVPRLRAAGSHLRAAPDPSPGRDLAADRQRQDAGVHRQRAASRAW